MCHVWLKACWQYDQKWRKDFVLRFQLSTHISAFNLSRPTWMKQNSLDLKFSRAVWTFVQLQPINALSVSATVSAEVFCGTKKTLSLSPADSNWFIKEKGWDFSASPYCVHNLPFGSYRILPILMLLWMLLPVMAFDGLAIYVLVSFQNHLDFPSQAGTLICNIRTWCQNAVLPCAMGSLYTDLFSVPKRKNDWQKLS